MNRTPSFHNYFDLKTLGVYIRVYCYQSTITLVLYSIKNLITTSFVQLAASHTGHGVLVGGGVLQQPPTHHLLTQNSILGEYTHILRNLQYTVGFKRISYRSDVTYTYLVVIKTPCHLKENFYTLILYKTVNAGTFELKQMQRHF